MNKTPAIFDGSAIGPDLAIEGGGVRLTTITDGLSIARMCRLTVGVDGFESIGEFIPYGASGTSLANKVSIGVVTADALTSDYVGADNQGIGYRPGEGAIYHDGASVLSVTAGALGDIINVRYVPDGEGGGSIVFYRKPLGGARELLGSVAIPASMQSTPLHLAGGVGSTDDPGDLTLHVNTGQDAFHDRILADPDAGWWEAPTLAGPLRVADRHFLSGKNDSPRYTRWEAGITEADIVCDRRLHFWIWGNAPSAAGAAVSVPITDPSGRFDPALGGAYRDQPATLVYVAEGDTLADAVSLGNYVVERVDPSSEIGRNILLRDPLAKFEVGLLRQRIRPDADEDSAGRLFPDGFGAFFSAPLVVLDKVTRTYALAASGAQGVGIVRDRGNPFDVSVPDYTIEDGGRVIVLANEPAGIVTADAGITGDGYVPPSPVDALGGIGNPFDGVIDGAITQFEVYRANPSNEYPRYAGAGQIKFQQNFPRDSWIRAVDGSAVPIQLLLGKTYRWTFTVYGAEPPGAIGARLSLSQSNNMFAEFGGTGFAADAVYPFTVSGVHSPAVDHDVWLYYTANNIVAGADCVIGNLEIIEIPSVDTSAAEAEIDAEVAALSLPLAEMCRQAIEVRAGFGSDVWDITTAEAIDTASGFEAGQGWWSAEQTTLRTYLDQLLAPYCASLFLRRDGKLAFARLVAPEDEIATGTIGPNDIIKPSVPLPKWDEMRGLTRKLGVRRNEHVFSDSEFATDLDATSWRARRKLTHRHRHIAHYGGPLAPGLGHADTAEPLDTRLVLLADGQRAIEHVGGIAAVPRFFWGPFRLKNPSRYELGQIVTLTWPRWGLSAGKNMMVVGLPDERRIADSGACLLWGLGPSEES